MTGTVVGWNGSWKRPLGLLVQVRSLVTSGFPGASSCGVAQESGWSAPPGRARSTQPMLLGGLSHCHMPLASSFLRLCRQSQGREDICGGVPGCQCGSQGCPYPSPVGCKPGVPPVPQPHWKRCGQAPRAGSLAGAAPQGFTSFPVDTDWVCVSALGCELCVCQLFQTRLLPAPSPAPCSRPLSV